MTDQEPLPEELARLFAAERAAPATDGGARTLIRSQLAATVALLPAKAAAVTGTATILGGAAGKIITIVAIGVGIGAAATRVTQPHEPPVASAPAIALHAVEEPAAPGPRVDVRPEEQQPRTAPERRGVVAPAPANVLPDLPSEVSLLKRAWSALSGGDAARALDLVDETERLHPDGALVEERQALRIQALAGTGQQAEARAAADVFLTQFPHSVHRTRVTNALPTEASP